MHTPGPWTVDTEVTDPDTLNTAPEVSATLPNGDTRYICRMFGTAPQVIEESQANARLIAAAPEMLKVCDRVHRHINGLNATMRAADFRYAHSELCRQLTELVRDAAIALATTQEPNP